jgi:hypothetical protein
MTGVVAGLTIVGKFMAPYAAKASIALAKHGVYRYRIERTVRRRCDFDYPHRRFRRWLKTVSEAELSERVETAGPRLAVRLDEFLAANTSWSTRPDRTSLALQLVEATYVAILRVADPALGRQLSEQWGKQRNEEMVAGLVQVSRDIGRWTIAAGDLAVWLRLRSKERRRIRLAAFDVSAEAIALSLCAVDGLVPVIAPGSFRVLVGPFGAGKSEIAEAWHLRALDELDDNGPVPVWIYARNVATGGGLDRAIAASVGLGQIASRGVQVVIDGLDEVDGMTAEGIAMDARVLVAGSPKSSVLATARRGVLPVTDSDIDVDGLSEEAARSLVSTLSGRRHTTWEWTPQLVETIRRPFFALAAGSLLATGVAPKGQAGLIKHLVERALRVGSSASSMPSDSLFELLVKLAVSLTGSNGASDGLAFRERQQAVSTRLVNSVEGGSVTFALPVFEQWFASQALLASPPRIAEALAHPRSFDRWRWAIAIAVMSGNYEQVDDLIEACLRMNPGAGAWVVAQVEQGRGRVVRPGGGMILDPSTSPGRLLRATRTWVDAIGNLAPGVFPVASPADPIRLGVRICGDALDHAWSMRPGPVDEVVALPDSVLPFAAPDSDWVGLHSGRPPQGTAWPWETRRDDIARNILRLLDGNLVLGPDGGVWQREARYRVARIVNRNGSVLHPPLDRESTIDILEDMLMQAGGDIHRVGFVINGRNVDGPQFADLHSWLESQTFAHFERPVPTPDKGFAPGSGAGWVSDVYSNEQLVRLTSEVYGNACLAYDEMADSWFASFGWSLGNNACRPFGVLGKIKFRKSERPGNVPVLDYVQVPMDILSEEIRSRADLTVSTNGRAGIVLPNDDKHEEWWELPERWTRFRYWADQHSVESPFWSLSWSSTVIECAHDRPASLQAATWMWNDLKRLNLTSGTFPQLNK